jgi:hypothetical protein
LVGIAVYILVALTPEFVIIYTGSSCRYSEHIASVIDTTRWRQEFYRLCQEYGAIPVYFQVARTGKLRGAEPASTKELIETSFIIIMGVFETFSNHAQFSAEWHVANSMGDDEVGLPPHAKGGNRILSIYGPPVRHQEHLDERLQCYFPGC